VFPINWDIARKARHKIQISVFNTVISFVLIISSAPFAISELVALFTEALLALLQIPTDAGLRSNRGLSG
jgi:hypothetical protein